MNLECECELITNYGDLRDFFFINEEDKFEKDVEFADIWIFLLFENGHSELVLKKKLDWDIKSIHVRFNIEYTDHKVIGYGCSFGGRDCIRWVIIEGKSPFTFVGCFIFNLRSSDPPRERNIEHLQSYFENEVKKHVKLNTCSKLHKRQSGFPRYVSGMGG